MLIWLIFHLFGNLSDNSWRQFHWYTIYRSWDSFNSMKVVRGAGAYGSNVPTDQIPCKTIGISNLHCALHTHMLTNVKSIVVSEIGVIHTLVKVYIFKRKFCGEFKCATNFLLDGKLKIENGEIYWLIVRF